MFTSRAHQQSEFLALRVDLRPDVGVGGQRRPTVIGPGAFDAANQTDAARVDDHWQAAQAVQPLLEDGLHSSCVLEQAFALDDLPCS